MKNLLITSLIVLVSACGQAPSQLAAKVTGTSGSTGASSSSCSLPIVGTFINDTDGLIMTIGDRNGLCGFQLSCGFMGYIFDDGANQYTIVTSVAEGDTAGNCGYPAQFSNIQGINGQFAPISFGLYQPGWLGVVVPNEVGNTWTKQ